METERLILRRITQNDFELMRHLDSDPEVLSYIGPPFAEEHTHKRMQKIKRRNEDNSGLGYWMAQQKENDECLGWFVLNNVLDTEEIEIGYRLKESAWGKGYATEGSRVLLNHAFTKVELRKVIGLTHLENEASKKVLTKIGLVEKGIRFYYDQNVSYFELTQVEYLNFI